MRWRIPLLGLVLLLVGGELSAQDVCPVQGAWQLESLTFNGEAWELGAYQQIKLLTASHFAWQGVPEVGDTLGVYGLVVPRGRHPGRRANEVGSYCRGLAPDQVGLGHNQRSVHTGRYALLARRRGGFESLRAYFRKLLSLRVLQTRDGDPAVPFFCSSRFAREWRAGRTMSCWTPPRRSTPPPPLTSQFHR
jgi:hypothetical protein